MKKLLIGFLLCLSVTILAQRFVRVVDTAAELVLSNPYNVHTNVWVVGLTNATDGRGGIFTWAAGDSTATNEWDVFGSTTTTNGRWKRKSYSSGTNYIDSSFITNLLAGTIQVTNVYVTNLVSTDIYATNLYVTNLYTTNIIGGNVTATTELTIGDGTDYSLSNTNYERVVFGTTSVAAALPSAGTYIVWAALSMTNSSTATHHFELWNDNTAAVVAGSYANCTTYGAGSIPVFVQTVTTVAASNNIHLYGFTEELVYGNAAVISTNTVMGYVKISN